jgi:D-serine deaminase-like pyridoxal phosphate-dependent protein
MSGTENRFSIADTSSIISPALVVFVEVLRDNLDEMIRVAGDVSRLRPHCKTHKMLEVVQMEIELGITMHKCATFAEAEMLAQAGVMDIFLAYNMVGPNISRVVVFRQAYPEVTLSVTADHSLPIGQLDAAMQMAGMSVDVLLDVDSGQHRTGVVPDEKAEELYRQINDATGLVAGGLHLYDGQNHQTDLEERRLAVLDCWQQVSSLRDRLVAAGHPVPRIVAGGTGSFPVYATIDDPALELSPGTNVMFDGGYGRIFPDLAYVPAARILSRVISCPTSDTVTLDLGYKACASDPPVERRVFFPDLPDAVPVLQNEEHLVLKTSLAGNFQPGDELLAIPGHVCPTSALHKQAYVVSGGQLVDAWPIASRDRWLTV